jgi:hypothetical protein
MTMGRVGRARSVWAVANPVRSRDHPVMATLALPLHRPPTSDLQVLKSQSPHLAPAQPHQQHPQHHRPVPVRVQCTDQPVGLLGDEFRGRGWGTRTSGAEPGAAKGSLSLVVNAF